MREATRIKIFNEISRVKLVEFLIANILIVIFFDRDDAQGHETKFAV